MLVVQLHQHHRPVADRELHAVPRDAQPHLEPVGAAEPGGRGATSG